MHILSSASNLLDTKTFRQLSVLVEVVLSMTGRVTMLSMSRWSEEGGRGAIQKSNNLIHPQ